mmetsp:Transcript_78992/g.231902  ORF Transcript_78992/g.231902 Transcript_78992/m.231902 type:complete len:234 (-) Transcript_78992:336-1037(-)
MEHPVVVHDQHLAGGQREARRVPGSPLRGFMVGLQHGGVRLRVVGVLGDALRGEGQGRPGQAAPQGTPAARRPQDYGRDAWEPRRLVHRAELEGAWHPGGGWICCQGVEHGVAVDQEVRAAASAGLRAEQQEEVREEVPVRVAVGVRAEALLLQDAPASKDAVGHLGRRRCRHQVLPEELCRQLRRVLGRCATTRKYAGSVLLQCIQGAWHVLNLWTSACLGGGDGGAHSVWM